MHCCVAVWPYNITSGICTSLIDLHCTVIDLHRTVIILGHDEYLGYRPFSTRLHGPCRAIKHGTSTYRKLYKWHFNMVAKILHFLCNPDSHIYCRLCIDQQVYHIPSGTACACQPYAEYMPSQQVYDSP